MRALVVYESLYGNTKRVAEAIGEGLSARYDVVIRPIGDQAKRLIRDVDLLVVGAPTHGRGMSSQSTRETGTHGVPKELLSVGTGTARGARDWLARLGVNKGARAATFDTRIRGPRVLVGSASRAIARGLYGLGYRIVGKAESFTVRGQTGPLLDGELDRARTWGEHLAELTGSEAVAARPSRRG